VLPTPQPTCLLIADISGYTGYLAEVELDHAQDILADLIGTVVSALRPRFKLAKLEGDAAFMAMPAEAIDGTVLLDTIERCYFGFRRRRRDVRQASSCDCGACSRIPDLDLKFVIHHGQALTQKVAGRSELLGSDVVVVHRLLKNQVVERLGIAAYALLTERCLAATDLDPVALGMRPATETYDRIGDVPCWVLDLDRRWAEEDARARVRVAPDEAVLTVSVSTTAPPQVAWEFLTTPGRRRAWQAGLTELTVTGATGGRRGAGTANHCVHGAETILEEIVDWRPDDYVTDWSTVPTPAGPIRALHTMELEPTPDGTTVHFRIGRSPTDREHRIVLDALPTFEAIFRASQARLVADLDAWSAGRANRGDDEREPDLPAPRPGGAVGDGRAA
jgi:hypothetical protein